MPAPFLPFEDAEVLCIPGPQPVHLQQHLFRDFIVEQKLGIHLSLRPEHHQSVAEPLGPGGARPPLGLCPADASKL